MPRDNLIRLIAENAWRLNAPDPRSGAADLVELLEKELGPIPVAQTAETAPQQVEVLTRKIEDLKADKATLQAEVTALKESYEAARIAELEAAARDQAKLVAEEFARDRETIDTLTKERDDAREAGRQALDQLKGLKSAAATAATATLEAVVPTEQPAATDQAAAA